MYLIEEEKQVLLKLYKSDCDESIVKSMPVKVVQSLTNRNIIQSVINYGEIIDIRLLPKTKDYIKDNLL